MEYNSNSSNVTGPVYLDPGVNVWGLVGVIVFYLAVLLIGLYASWKSKAYKDTDSEGVMLAGRDLGLVVGVFTMTATWVGGGFINGTAEFVFTPGHGLAWCTAPVGYAVALTLAGLFFAAKMRTAGYVTMLDPFEERYGQVMSSFLYIPPLLGETFWCGAILAALGASLAVILGIDKIPAILISAGVATFYTVIGGLYSVVFTDVIQLTCIFIGLWLGAGFALVHPAVTPLAKTAHGPDGWLGYFPTDAWAGYYTDTFLLTTFGGIPWQAYFQRVLASKDPGTARLLSCIASFGCIILAIPAVVIGAIAFSTDWNQTEYRLYRPVPVPKEDYTLILPLVLQYLTPVPVAVIGLGAVSAAVMSSADSSLMSASSMFAHNVYTPIRNACYPKRRASEREILWTMRICILAVGTLATLIAIVVNSIYSLFVLCGDLVYVVAFPQLTAVIYVPFSNTYGAAAGYFIAFFFRLTGGEPLIGLPPLIKYPNFDEETQNQLFPFKTMTMVISLAIIIGVSYVADRLFKRNVLKPNYDIFKCFPELAVEEMKDYPDGSSNKRPESLLMTEDEPPGGVIRDRRHASSDPRRSAPIGGATETETPLVQGETIA